MRYYRIFRAALRALRRNVMRSLLTTLGIVIGIAAVIAMMEIGKGSSSAIQRTIATMGANNLLVMPGTAASGGVSFGAGSVLTLTPQDTDAILQDCPAVRAAAVSSADIPAAIQQIQGLLRDRHHIRADEADDFTVRDMTEMSKALSSTTLLMPNLLLGVALISLVVGGVGIMNIMLVSVTERTREIGLRMAVGARARDILRQFLIEAVMLCLVGGVLGILVGRGSSYLVSVLLKWPTEISVTAIEDSRDVTVTLTAEITRRRLSAGFASALDVANAVTSNRVAVGLSTRLYTAGELDFPNLLTAQRNLYTSEDALVQVDRTIAVDLIALYKGLGGGWEPDAQAGQFATTGKR